MMMHERAFRTLCNTVDVDAEFLTILIEYVDLLVAIGVDLSDRALQEAIEGNVSHLESACRAVIGYAGWLAAQGDRFQDATHATRCFTRALREHWHPYPNWHRFGDWAKHSKYVSPYEAALCLLYQIQTVDDPHRWDPAVLDAMSDAAIERLIPHLNRHLKTHFPSQAIAPATMPPPIRPKSHLMPVGSILLTAFPALMHNDFPDFPFRVHL